jgi:hypothetical protein
LALVLMGALVVALVVEDASGECSGLGLHNAFGLEQGRAATGEMGDFLGQLVLIELLALLVS